VMGKMGRYETGVMGGIGSLTAGAVLLGMFWSPSLVQAQVIPDATLPLENSIVTTDGTAYQITGGANRGSNLFHSFEQFSVPAGTTAVFVNADNIANILSRVTGGTRSDLQGTIQAGGSANLFLINPAGIVFGPNARLDIGGSFFASTGEGLRFDNGFVYGTANPEAPPLLTVSAPIGLRLGNGSGGNTPGDIAVAGANLSVAEGQTLALVGGNVSLTGAQITAPGGRIEVGGVQAGQELRLTPDGPGFDVGFDGVNNFGDIQLSNRSVLNASGIAGGAIDLRGRSVTLADRSALISDTLGDQDGRGVQVAADQFRLLGSSYIGAANSGSGAGSSVEVTANDIDMVGTGIANYKLVEFSTFLGARQVSDRQIGGITATTTASGRAGDISLQAQRISLDAGVLVSTETFGTGDSGDIRITATTSFRASGSGIVSGSRVSGIPLVTPDGFPTGLSTRGIAAGGGGNITVNTAQLLIEEGSAIAALTLSDQDSGNILIRAPHSVIVRGFFDPFPLPTTLSMNTFGGNGTAGNLQIETGRLLVQDGAAIIADSGSRGIDGNITFGGAAGDISIVATDSVDIIGNRTVVAGLAASGVRSRTFSDAPAGTIQIATPLLNVRDGGLISSATLNDGAGGAINIDAQIVVVSGDRNRSVETFSSIGASSGVERQTAFTTGAIEASLAAGAGGTITITTTNLVVQGAAEISVGSFGSGAAGNLNISAEAVLLDRDGSLTATTTVDGGGNIFLTADTLALDGSRITASSESGDGGNLTFTLRDLLLLRNGSLISTEAGTAGAGGNGGDITLTLPTGFIVAVPLENSDIRANAFEGDGGSVTITARSLLGIAFRPDVLDTPLSDITASSRFGNSGTVTITELAPDIAQNEAELPTETAPTALAQGCRAQGTQ
ncbi:filamentous hemagglutinin N-terminal domain-containing protein, partial [Nodosilinea sp. LEGE 07298]|uniref:two-partner secretion domain-containing protein n=1 Tax=Nodosilinea sp. LEGE 07298 TaxID=2777970 RepID=UPI001A065738